MGGKLGRSHSISLWSLHSKCAHNVLIGQCESWIALASSLWPCGSRVWDLGPLGTTQISRTHLFVLLFITLIGNPLSDSAGLLLSWVVHMMCMLTAGTSSLTHSCAPLAFAARRNGHQLLKEVRGGHDLLHLLFSWRTIIWSLSHLPHAHSASQAGSQDAQQSMPTVFNAVCENLLSTRRSFSEDSSLHWTHSLVTIASLDAYQVFSGFGHHFCASSRYSNFRFFGGSC